MAATTLINEIQTRYDEEWGETLPTAYPNDGFTPVVGSPWVRLNTEIYKRRIVNLGSLKTYRTKGVIKIQLFYPKDDGAGDSLEQADVLAEIFNKWVGTTVMCRESTVLIVGENNDGWYQVNIHTPFVQDEQIT